MARRGIGDIILPRRKRLSSQSDDQRILLELKKEFLCLTLIFINLIFIHIQRTIILMAHQKAAGINRVYFCVALALIVLLIPYYRIRVKAVLSNSSRLG